MFDPVIRRQRRLNDLGPDGDGPGPRRRDVKTRRKQPPARLALIVYVIASPLLPLVWRGTRVGLIVVAGVSALVVQAVAVGIVNFWL